ncbi:MAG: leucine-rich repeat protein [Treponema sp.]|nr:leucine-rich repeat protein [Treponema sp.]
MRGNPHKYVEITLGENCEANCWGLFQACESLTSVTMICPSGGNVSWMFSGCTNLASVELTSIPDARNAEGMFASCDSLKLVSLPDMPSLTEAPQMFYSCGLVSISLPDMPRLERAEYMFENCSALKSIVLGDYPVLRYADGMFYNCMSLKTVTLPPGNFSVAGMFYNCSSLETVYGWAKDYNDPNSGYGIDHNGQVSFIFQNCDSLTAIYVRKDDSHPQDSSSWRSFLVSHGSGSDDTVTVYATDGTVEASATVTNADGRSVEATDWVDELLLSGSDISGAKVADMMATRMPITGNTDASDPSQDTFTLWARDGDRLRTNVVQMTDSDFDDIFAEEE